MVAAETIEPAKPKYLLSGPLQKKVTDPGLNMIEVYFSIMGSPAEGRVVLLQRITQRSMGPMEAPPSSTRDFQANADSDIWEAKGRGCGG